MAAAGQLNELSELFDQESAEVRDRASWEALRLRWTGKKQGLLRSLMGRMKDLAPEERRSYGQGVNLLKKRVDGQLQELDRSLRAREEQLARQDLETDVTLPGRAPKLGSLHPITVIRREIEEIFAELGYSVAEGPEVEDDFHNFEALNFPPDHPARDTQDTLFVNNGLVLRTHTSPVQIRTMLSRKPPIRVICPGRVFRNDNDLRHSPMFHQVEGLAVAEGLTVGDLKGTLEAFVQRLLPPTPECGCGPATFPSRNLPRRWTSPAPSAPAPVTTARCARVPVGWRFWVPAWSIHGFSPDAESTRSAIADSHSDWESTG